MSAEIPRTRIRIQPKGNNGEIDIYRINGPEISHETFSLIVAGKIIQDRAASAASRIDESGILLSISTALTAALLVGTLRKSPKILTATSLLAGASVVYAKSRWQAHRKESKLLEKEGIALELYSDMNTTSVPQKQQP